MVSEVDLGFHLGAGSWILDNLTWPRTDPFTFTVPENEYIDLHWFYQVISTLIYRSADLAGLVFFHSFLLLVALLTAFRTAWTRFTYPLFHGGYLLLIVLASEFRFFTRPEIASWLLLCLTLLILDKYNRTKRSPLWVLPLIHLFWVNIQGIFILGWLVMGCYLAGILISSRKIDGKLGFWGLISILSCFINPYFHRGVLFPLTLFTRLGGENPFSRTIGEFISPWFLEPLTCSPLYVRPLLWSYYAVAVLGTALLLLTLKKRRPSEIMVFVVFLYLSSSAIRNIPLFMLTTYPVVTASFRDFLLYFHREDSGQPLRLIKLKPLCLILLVILNVGIGTRVVTGAYYISDRRFERFGISLDPDVLPVNAVRYLEWSRINGKLYNALHDGGYLIWKLPESRVYIDGRLEVMEEELYHEYMQTKYFMLSQLLEERNIDIAVFPYVREAGWFNQLQQSPKWKQVYFDALSVVFLRNQKYSRIPKVTINRRNVAGINIPVSPKLKIAVFEMKQRNRFLMWLEGFYYLQEYPQRELNLATLGRLSGNNEMQEAILVQAILNYDGQYFELFGNLGKHYFQTGQYQNAIFCLNRVLELKSGDDTAVKLLRNILLLENKSNIPGSSGKSDAQSPGSRQKNTGSRSKE